MNAHTLLDHWETVVQIVVYVSGAVGLYFKLRGQMMTTRGMITTLRADVAEMKERYSEHIESQTPHINCPVHQQAIEDITGRLDRIQGDISGVRVDLSTLNKTLLLIATNTHKVAP